jgi:DNA-binding response OmpR family regulator
MDGLEVLRRLREENRATPVLLLTARDSVADRVRGLDAGANDYLVKPFAFDELMARVRVLLREKDAVATNVFTLADLTLDCSRHIVERGGQVITLSAKEFALLEYLLRNQGIVLSREQIENHVWDYDYEGGTNVVDVYIRYLRKKIDEAHAVKLIHTVRGSGYVLREGDR